MENKNQDIPLKDIGKIKAQRVVKTMNAILNLCRQAETIGTELTEELLQQINHEETLMPFINPTIARNNNNKLSTVKGASIAFQKFLKDLQDVHK